MTEHQAALIAALKSDGPALPVRTSGGTHIGYLMPITARRAADRGVIERICRWRERHKGAFLTIVAPDPENTRRYLEDLALSGPARILFLIADLQKQPVGNIGLCNVAADSAELDNVVRGEPATLPDFMYWVCVTVLNFAFDELGINSIHVKVLSDNPRAIALYYKLRFVERARRPLARQAFADGYRLVETESGKENAGDPVLVLMELNEPAFAAATNNLCGA
jgi:RimJ/RimL family protein N-acetyltransferase